MHTTLLFNKEDHSSPGDVDKLIQGLSKWRSHLAARGQSTRDLDNAVRELRAYHKLLCVGYEAEAEDDTQRQLKALDIRDDRIY